MERRVVTRADREMEETASATRRTVKRVASVTRTRKEASPRIHRLKQKLSTKSLKATLSKEVTVPWVSL